MNKQLQFQYDEYITMSHCAKIDKIDCVSYIKYDESISLKSLDKLFLQDCKFNSKRNISLKDV